jgi:RNA polymerase sigma-70 factor (ECF subfamily)
MVDQTSILDLLTRARGGDHQARGELLNLYRNYLGLLARAQMGASLRVRVEPSDLVQETLLDAHRDFSGFAGHSERELLSWLRRILVRSLLDQAKRNTAQMRDGRRQQSLEALLEASNSALDSALGIGSTPSLLASRREQVVLLADALERLPPDYREVIVLRNLQKLAFEEVAQRMGRKAGAVRMLWARALEKLGAVMGEPT